MQCFELRTIRTSWLVLFLKHKFLLQMKRLAIKFNRMTRCHGKCKKQNGDCVRQHQRKDRKLAGNVCACVRERERDGWKRENKYNKQKNVLYFATSFEIQYGW